MEVTEEQRTKVCFCGYFASLIIIVIFFALGLIRLFEGYGVSGTFIFNSILLAVWIFIGIGYQCWKKQNPDVQTTCLC